jgi:hypothetical protein
MATHLSVAAVEESTYVVTAAFTNEDGDPVIPSTVVWTLSDIDGTIINSRENVAETPATTVNIVLTGDDLAVSGSYTRIVTVIALYNSDYGTGLSLKAAASFNLENLVVVT